MLYYSVFGGHDRGQQKRKTILYNICLSVPSFLLLSVLYFADCSVG